MMMKINQKIRRIDHVTTDIISKDQFHIVHYPEHYPVTSEPHRHNHYEILWFPNGEGTHCIDDVCFKITKNDLFLLSEGQVHYYQDVKNVQGYMLMFKDVFWQEALQSVHNFRTSLFNHLLINVHLQLPNEEALKINRIMNDILQEYALPDYPGKAEVMISYLKILLIRISNFQRTVSLPSPHSNKSDYLLFQQFIELLEEYYTAHRDVLFYAEKLNITSHKLGDICRQYNSRNPKSLIEDRVLITAKRQLQFDAGAIKEIAAVLNFPDQFQFSKFFKRLTGTSPVEYRSQFIKTDI